MLFFYKHMKFWDQARLCLAIYNLEVRIMLSLCLTFQGTELPRYGKNLTSTWLQIVNLFSVILINLIKKENIVLSFINECVLVD